MIGWRQLGHFLYLHYKYIARLSIAGVLTIGFAYWARLPLLGGMFSMVYAMIIVQTNVGATLSTLRSLGGWVLGGLLAGFLAFLLLGASFNIHPDLIWLVLLLLAMVAAVLSPISRFVRMALVSASFVLIYGTSSHAPFLTALARASYLLVAVLIGLLVTYFVFPQKASQLLIRQVNSFLQRSAALFSVISHCCLQEKSEERCWEESVQIAKVSRLRDNIQESIELVENAKKERFKANFKLLEVVIVAENRITALLLDSIRLAHRMRGNRILALVRKPINDLIDLINQLIADWLRILQHQKSIDDLADLTQIIKHIEATLHVQRDFLRTLPIRELTLFFAFYNLLQSFASRMLETLQINGEKNKTMPLKKND